MSDGRRHRRSSQPVRRATGAHVRGDTIAAIATAAGRSAIAVVRMSGPDAERIGRKVLTPYPTTARTLTRCAVHPAEDRTQIIDHALAVVFAAPASYTGETVIEVHTHGGTFVPRAVLDALVGAGARPALAGEFTERAVLNGKLDLVRAETIGELIDARTGMAHRSAVLALSGTLTRAYAALRDEALALDALIAFDIDFPEEDHGPVSRTQVEVAAQALAGRLQALIDSAPAATLGREGALVVLAGPPNAGKSTLLNALVGESRAIVSDEPGTTRDAIEVMLDGDPWPMRLVDTAGLRTSNDVVERLGIEVSERYLRSADIVILCAESDVEVDEALARVREETDATILRVRTKIDLDGRAADTNGVSALTGAGLGDLRRQIMAAITERAGTSAELPALAISARQRAALGVARAEVGAFLSAWRERSLPAPVAAAHLRGATNALDHLIGAIDADEVLAQVFATFCVGK